MKDMKRQIQVTDTTEFVPFITFVSLLFCLGCGESTVIETSDCTGPPPVSALRRGSEFPPESGLPPADAAQPTDGASAANAAPTTSAAGQQANTSGDLREGVDFAILEAMNRGSMCSSYVYQPRDTPREQLEAIAIRLREQLPKERLPADRTLSVTFVDDPTAPAKISQVPVDTSTSKFGWVLVHKGGRIEWVEVKN